MIAPVFLLSSERSGSNLIRVMMDTHPRFSAPHSPHLVRVFVPMLPSYGDLQDPDNLGVLAADMLHVLSVQMRGWNVMPTRDKVLEQCTEHSFAGLLDALYGIAASENGKTRSFIKDNGNVFHAANLSVLFPDACFVYLVRDARDVALSWKKSPGHPGGVREAIKMWRAEQEAALQFLSLRGIAQRVTVVHYEDLVTHPEQQLKEICKMCDEEYDEQMLTFHRGKEAATSSNAAIGWKNLTNPVMNQNYGKFASELSRREQRIVEGMGGRQMVQLGYPLGQFDHARGRERGTMGKLFKFARAAIPQLLRGPAGVRELKMRTKRLQGMRGIMMKAANRNPCWHRPEVFEKDPDQTQESSKHG